MRAVQLGDDGQTDKERGTSQSTLGSGRMETKLTLRDEFDDERDRWRFGVSSQRGNEPFRFFPTLHTRWFLIAPFLLGTFLVRDIFLSDLTSWSPN